MERPLASVNDFEILKLYQNNALLRDYTISQAAPYATAGMKLVLIAKLKEPTDSIFSVSLIRNTPPPTDAIPTTTQIVLGLPPYEITFDADKVVAYGNPQKIRVDYTKGPDNLVLDLEVNVIVSAIENTEAARFEAGAGLSIITPVSGSDQFVVFGKMPPVSLWIADTAKLPIISVLIPMKRDGDGFIPDPAYPGLVGSEQVFGHGIFAKFDFPRNYRPTHVAFRFMSERDSAVSVFTDRRHPVELNYIL